MEVNGGMELQKDISIGNSLGVKCPFLHPFFLVYMDATVRVTL